MCDKIVSYIFKNTIMKIINNTDINNLIIFSKKNLGIYRLVYKEQKNLYCLSIIAVIFSIFLLITYILLVILHINILIEKICCFSCLFVCLCALILLIHVENKTKHNHLKIQNVRFRILKKYYRDNNYSSGDIKVINRQLEKRIEKIEKQKITILVVIGIMIMSIWDIFVEAYFNEFNFMKVSKFLVLLIIISLIIVIIIRFFNRALYLYEENFYIKNNIALIENLIYLNEFIIQEEEERSNGRRR